LFFHFIGIGGKFLDWGQTVIYQKRKKKRAPRARSIYYSKKEISASGGSIPNLRV